MMRRKTLQNFIKFIAYNKTKKYHFKYVGFVADALISIDQATTQAEFKDIKSKTIGAIMNKDFSAEEKRLSYVDIGNQIRGITTPEAAKSFLESMGIKKISAQDATKAVGNILATKAQFTQRSNPPMLPTAKRKSPTEMDEEDNARKRFRSAEDIVLEKEDKRRTAFKTKAKIDADFVNQKWAEINENLRPFLSYIFKSTQAKKRVIAGSAWEIIRTTSNVNTLMNDDEFLQSMDIVASVGVSGVNVVLKSLGYPPLAPAMLFTSALGFFKKVVQALTSNTEKGMQYRINQLKSKFKKEIYDLNKEYFEPTNAIRGGGALPAPDDEPTSRREVLGQIANTGKRLALGQGEPALLQPPMETKLVPRESRGFGFPKTIAAGALAGVVAAMPAVGIPVAVGGMTYALEQMARNYLYPPVEEGSSQAEQAESVEVKAAATGIAVSDETAVLVGDGTVQTNAVNDGVRFSATTQIIIAGPYQRGIYIPDIVGFVGDKEYTTPNYPPDYQTDPVALDETGVMIEIGDYLEPVKGITMRQLGNLRWQFPLTTLNLKMLRLNIPVKLSQKWVIRTPEGEKLDVRLHLNVSPSWFEQEPMVQADIRFKPKFAGHNAGDFDCTAEPNNPYPVDAFKLLSINLNPIPVDLDEENSFFYLANFKEFVKREDALEGKTPELIWNGNLGPFTTAPIWKLNKEIINQLRGGTSQLIQPSEQIGSTNLKPTVNAPLYIDSSLWKETSPDVPPQPLSTPSIVFEYQLDADPESSTGIMEITDFSEIDGVITFTPLSPDPDNVLIPSTAINVKIILKNFFNTTDTVVLELSPVDLTSLRQLKVVTVEVPDSGSLNVDPSYFEESVEPINWLMTLINGESQVPIKPIEEDRLLGTGQLKLSQVLKSASPPTPLTTLDDDSKFEVSIDGGSTSIGEYKIDITLLKQGQPSVQTVTADMFDSVRLDPSYFFNPDQQEVNSLKLADEYLELVRADPTLVTINLVHLQTMHHLAELTVVGNNVKIMDVTLPANMGALNISNGPITVEMLFRSVFQGFEPTPKPFLESIIPEGQIDYYQKTYVEFQIKDANQLLKIADSPVSVGVLPGTVWGGVLRFDMEFLKNFLPEEGPSNLGQLQIDLYQGDQKVTKIKFKRETINNESFKLTAEKPALTEFLQGDLSLFRKHSVYTSPNLSLRGNWDSLGKDIDKEAQIPIPRSVYTKLVSGKDVDINLFGYGGIQLSSAYFEHNELTQGAFYNDFTNILTDGNIDHYWSVKVGDAIWGVSRSAEGDKLTVVPDTQTDLLTFPWSIEVKLQNTSQFPPNINITDQRSTGLDIFKKDDGFTIVVKNGQGWTTFLHDHPVYEVTVFSDTSYTAKLPFDFQQVKLPTPPAPATGGGGGITPATGGGGGITPATGGGGGGITPATGGGGDETDVFLSDLQIWVHDEANNISALTNVTTADERLGGFRRYRLPHPETDLLSNIGDHLELILTSEKGSGMNVGVQLTQPDEHEGFTHTPDAYPNELGYLTLEVTDSFKYRSVLKIIKIREEGTTPGLWSSIFIGPMKMNKIPYNPNPNPNPNPDPDPSGPDAPVDPNSQTMSKIKDTFGVSVNVGDPIWYRKPHAKARTTDGMFVTKPFDRWVHAQVQSLNPFSIELTPYEEHPENAKQVGLVGSVVPESAGIIVAKGAYAWSEVWPKQNSWYIPPVRDTGLMQIEGYILKDVKDTAQESAPLIRQFFGMRGDGSAVVQDALSFNSVYTSSSADVTETVLGLPFTIWGQAATAATGTTGADMPTGKNHDYHDNILPVLNESIADELLQQDNLRQAEKTWLASTFKQAELNKEFSTRDKQYFDLVTRDTPLTKDPLHEHLRLGPSATDLKEFMMEKRRKKRLVTSTYTITPLGSQATNALPPTGGVKPRLVDLPFRLGASNPYLEERRDMDDERKDFFTQNIINNSNF